MKTSKLWIGSIILALTLQACNLKLVEAGDPAAPNYELTMTANAALLETAMASGALPPTEPGLPVVQEPAAAGNEAPPPTEDPNSASVNSATPTVSSASGVTVVVSVATNCRTGPGQAYPSVYGLPVNVAGKVVGKNPSVSNYWVIEIPNSGGGTCWLWGQYATVTGDTSGLKVFAVPATPTPTKTNTPTPTKTSQPTATNTTAAAVAPAAPAILASSVVCSDAGGGNQKYAFEVTWADKSDNETMFVITTSVNGLFSKGPNVTFFAFSETLPAGTTLTLNLVAQNATGSSAPVSTTFVCP